MRKFLGNGVNCSTAVGMGSDILRLAVNFQNKRLLLISTFAFAQQPVVRNERWGMTKAEVIQAEKHPPLKQHPDQLTYLGTKMVFTHRSCSFLLAGNSIRYLSLRMARKILKLHW